MASPVVVFPETDRAEWVNKIIHQFWPFLGDFMQSIFKDSVEPQVQEAVHSSFVFSKIDMGVKPLRIEGVRVYNIRKGEIYMDMDIKYASDADIDVGMFGITNAAGIKDITLKGTLRVTMKPLLSAAPLIGGVSFFFITNPVLDFEFTNLANILDFAPIKEKLLGIIQVQLSNLLVFPKRMEYIIGQGTKFSTMLCPRPQGVLTMNIIEASNLKDADTIGADSDPYAIVRVGDQSFETKTLKNDSNPKWNETFDTLVDLAEESLFIKVMDKDSISADDCLGKAHVDIARVQKNGSLDEWLTLTDAPHGKVHLKLSWFYLANDVALIEKTECAKCLLLVCVISAEGIQPENQNPEKISAAVTLSFEGQELMTTSPVSGRVPSWETNFRFLMLCAKKNTISFKVKDTKNDAVYGTLKIPITDLISAEDMTIDKSYPLVTSLKGIKPTLKIKMVLRALTADKDPRWLADSFQ